MEQKIFYKVVRVELDDDKDNKTYTSAVIKQEIGKIEYPSDGSWINPPILNSKLFVFSSYYDALKFSIDNQLYYTTVIFEIFEVEVRNPKTIYDVCSLWSGDLSRFWNIDRISTVIDDYDNRVVIINAPSGTVGVDSLRLKRKIMTIERKK